MKKFLKKYKKFLITPIILISSIVLMFASGEFEHLKEQFFPNDSINEEIPVGNFTNNEESTINNNTNKKAEVINNFETSGLKDYVSGMEKVIIINNNISGFDNGDLNDVWYTFSPLDNYGRPQEANAVLDQSLYRSSKDRPRINVNPPGWHNKKVKSDGSFVDLYNRSHLIAYTFINDEIDIETNLITGTSEFNQSTSIGMQYVENLVRDKIKSGHTVRYSVKPIYKYDELVAHGVQMRYYSSDGDELNVFIYNVLDDVEIDYSTGYTK